MKYFDNLVLSLRLLSLSIAGSIFRKVIMENTHIASSLLLSIQVDSGTDQSVGHNSLGFHRRILCCSLLPTDQVSRHCHMTYLQN